VDIVDKRGEREETVDRHPIAVRVRVEERVEFVGREHVVDGPALFDLRSMQPTVLGLSWDSVSRPLTDLMIGRKTSNTRGYRDSRSSTNAAASWRVEATGTP